MPVLDCDGMGRAFPEAEMFIPFIYGCDPFPATIADDKGRQGVVLRAGDPKELEDCLRQLSVSMGSAGGTVLSHLTRDQIMKYTVKHSLSFAWKIGNTIMKGRDENKSPVMEMIKCTNGKLLIKGKLTEVEVKTAGGFGKGYFKVDGLGNFAHQRILVDVLNEFILARTDDDDYKDNEVIACAPDLITVLDSDTAEPVLADDLRSGMQISVVAMPAPPLLTTEEALRRVGPQAFGYPPVVKYKPISEYPDYGPVGPK